MDKVNGMIPLTTSPDIMLMQTIDRWSNSKNAWKREGQTRLVSLVAGAPIAMVGALFNAMVIIIKLPVTTFRVLTGWIPTKNGHFRDDLPADTSVKHIIWHAYKVITCTIDIIFIPVMGLIHPKANNWVHVKLCISFAEEIQLPKHKIPQPPPPPPKTIDTARIEQRRNARGVVTYNGQQVRLCDFEAAAIRNRRLALRAVIDSEDDDTENTLPLGPDDLEEVEDKIWGIDLDPEDLRKQRLKLRNPNLRVLPQRQPSPIDLRQQEERRRQQAQNNAINNFAERAALLQQTDSTNGNNNTDNEGWGSDDDW